MFAFNHAHIDDDDYLLRYATACDPDGKPVAPEELPDIRAILKLEYGLAPRDDEEKELMASYQRLVTLIKNHDRRA
jgi:hypothetical protein